MHLLAVADTQFCFFSKSLAQTWEVTACICFGVAVYDAILTDAIEACT